MSAVTGRTLALVALLHAGCMLEARDEDDLALTDNAAVAADPSCARGIANGDVCCAASCGACGGAGCGARPGGAAACCTGTITSSGVSCSGAEAPCVMTGESPNFELLRADFQSQTTGNYSPSKVEADFGARPPWSNGLNEGRARVVQEGANKFLRVTYPANKFGPGEGGVQFNVALGARYEELFLSYRVRFGAGFDFVQGGKLPGLVGGSSPTGCTTDLTGGFSARAMWRPQGTMAQYLYYPERANRCGDDWYYTRNGTKLKFVPGRWHTLEHRIVMGTRGQRNGVMQAWLDGERVLDRAIKWRNTGANYGIDTLFFSTFFGGSDASWAPRTAQQVDFDDFVVADGPFSH